MEELCIIVGLILLNGLFSMSETALISARKNRLEQESRKGNSAARAALDIANDPDRFLSTIQIGITLIGILTGLYSGAKISGIFADTLSSWGMPGHYAAKVAQTTIVFAVTYLSIVVGELVPKRIALGASDSVAKIVARPMRLLSIAAMPFVWLLSVSTNIIVRLLHLKQDENRVTESDVRQTIESGAASGEVQKVEKDIMTRALVLGDQRVSSIMTCRNDVAVLDAGMSPDMIREHIAAELHDTYPVINGNRDNIIGSVSLKDLILTLDNDDFDLAAVTTPGTFIPENMTVYDALELLKKDRIHCLIICDEFGAMQGVMTLNDVLDGLVGNTGSTTDSYVNTLTDDEDETTVFDARCPVIDFLNYYDRCDLYEPSPYTTIGGLVLSRLRRLPMAGDTMSWHGFTFEVLNMCGARIGHLRVKAGQAITVNQDTHDR